MRAVARRRCLRRLEWGSTACNGRQVEAAADADKAVAASVRCRTFRTSPEPRVIPRLLRWSPPEQPSNWGPSAAEVAVAAGVRHPWQQAAAEQAPRRRVVAGAAVRR